MLPDAGPHAGFIWLAYAAAALVFAGLVIYAVLASRAQKRALARLDRDGPGRRRP